MVDKKRKPTLSTGKLAQSIGASTVTKRKREEKINYYDQPRNSLGKFTKTKLDDEEPYEFSQSDEQVTKNDVQQYLGEE